MTRPGQSLLTLSLHDAIIQYLQQRPERTTYEQLLNAIAELVRDYEQIMPTFRWRLVRQLVRPRHD